MLGVDPTHPVARWGTLSSLPARPDLGHAGRRKGSVPVQALMQLSEWPEEYGDADSPCAVKTWSRC